MANTPIRILIIESDDDEGAMLGSYLQSLKNDCSVTLATRVSSGLRLLASNPYDAVVLDLDAVKCNGLQGLHKILGHSPAMPVVVLTGLGNVDLASRAVADGAMDSLIKGSPECMLLGRTVRNAIEIKRLRNIIARAPESPSPRFPSGPARKRAAPARKLRTPRARSKFQAENKEERRILDVMKTFLNRVLHELGNTLTIMKTAGYCLKSENSGALNPLQIRMIDMILRTVDRQNRIVDNVLSSANFRSGKFKLQLSAANMEDIVGEVVREFRLMSSTREIALECEESVPVIDGDVDLLFQVMRNLIGNALRFSVHRVFVKVSSAKNEGVAVTVGDDGPGIDPERMSDLFSGTIPSTRTSQGNRHRGMGLGLTICKEIVSNHGGRIWAENGPERGAEFKLILPGKLARPPRIGTNGDAPEVLAAEVPQQ